MLRRDYPVEFLVEGVLAKGQHALWGGPLKACKTLTALDLAVSLAVGGRFLGYFRVPRPVKTIYLSGESGWPSFQDNLRRISRAARIKEEELGNLIVAIRLPKFGRFDYMEVLKKEITHREAEVVFVDCAYRAMGNSGDKAPNVISMGDLLDGVGSLFEELNATAGLVAPCN